MYRPKLGFRLERSAREGLPPEEPLLVLLKHGLPLPAADPAALPAGQTAAKLAAMLCSHILLDSTIFNV